MQIELIPLASLRIDRDARQRRRIDNLEELKSSLRLVGQINPVVLAQDGTLVAGERRCEAARQLGWEEIQAVRRGDLTTDELFLLELEENVKREDLHWTDRVRALAELSKRYAAKPQGELAEMLGMHPSTHSKMIVLAGNIDREAHADLAQMASWRTAYNTLSRRLSRDMDSEMERMLAGENFDGAATAGDAAAPDAPPRGESARPGTPVPTAPQSADTRPHIAPSKATDAGLPDQTPRPAQTESEAPIRCASFLQWAPEYAGPRFNFIHCDFPYGIDHNRSDQGGADRWGSYEDSPEVFFNLLESLIHNTDKIAAASAHLMFWFSMKHYAKILHYFEMTQDSRNPWVVNPVPLIWHKSDNTGILPDAQRGPRQVYETALIASRSDRKIVQAVANAYGSPGKDKSFVHQSHKSEAMLRHFFRMFVDGNSVVLDPTCGSGSALCAAKSLGAKELTGLELDAEMAETAGRRVAAQEGQV